MLVQDAFPAVFPTDSLRAALMHSLAAAHWPEWADPAVCAVPKIPGEAGPGREA